MMETILIALEITWNGRALCSSGTDLVLHLDYGEDWTEKVKNKEI